MAGLESGRVCTIVAVNIIADGAVQVFYGKFRDGGRKVDASDLIRRIVQEELIEFVSTPLFQSRISPTYQYAPCMTPFLKWPGGKRWFVSSHAELLPVEFRVYREPFLGSGAVFFHLAPRRAVLSDTNRELIATYRAIKTDALAIEQRLRRHQSLHDDNHYYRTRNAARTDDPRTEAARFLYLNRTCFNGIYRVNLQGVFNVPRGTKTAVVLPTDDFPEVPRVLWRAKLEVCDFG